MNLRRQIRLPIKKSMLVVPIKPKNNKRSNVDEWGNRKPKSVPVEILYGRISISL